MILRRPFRASLIFSIAGLVAGGLLLYLFSGDSYSTRSLVVVRESAAPELYPESAPSPIVYPESAPSPDPEPNILLQWPDDPDSARGRLSWPPAGCDAGMWSSTYTFEHLDEVTLRVSDGRDLSFVVPVRRGDAVRLYPASPQQMYVMSISPDRTSYTVSVTEGGEKLCSTERQLADSHGEVRAEVTRDGLEVFTRDDGSMTGILFDARCEERASERIPAKLLEPRPLQLLSAPSQTPVMNSIPPSNHQVFGRRGVFRSNLDWSSVPHGGLGVALDGFSFEAERRIESFSYSWSEDVAWAVYMDASKAYVSVFDVESKALRWSETFDRGNSRELPVSHLSYAGGFVSLRIAGGTADPGYTAVYDTHRARLVGSFPDEPQAMD